MATYPLSLDTIGKLIDGNDRLALHCEAPDCHHFAWADLPKLADRLGRDHGSMAADLAGKFRCAKCGSRRVGIRMHPPDRPFESAPAVQHIKGR